jgi:hypothetical protein
MAGSPPGAEGQRGVFTHEAGAVDGAQVPARAVVDRDFQVAVGLVPVRDGGLSPGAEGQRGEVAHEAGAVDGAQVPARAVVDRDLQVVVGSVQVRDGGSSPGAEGQRCVCAHDSGAVDGANLEVEGQAAPREESNNARFDAFLASNDARLAAFSASSSPIRSQISCRDFMVGAGGSTGARAPCANNPVQVMVLTKRTMKMVRGSFVFMASL